MLHPFPNSQAPEGVSLGLRTPFTSRSRPPAFFYPPGGTYRFGLKKESHELAFTSSSSYEDNYLLPSLFFPEFAMKGIYLWLTRLEAPKSMEFRIGRDPLLVSILFFWQCQWDRTDPICFNRPLYQPIPWSRKFVFILFFRFFLIP